jgi:hypothetical protein
MLDEAPSGKRWDNRLEAIAWKSMLGFFGASPAVFGGVLLLNLIQAPKAASAQLMPTWHWSWNVLGQDDPCPTPDGGYCDATLSRRRLCCGPFEIRYSHAY